MTENEKVKYLAAQLEADSNRVHADIEHRIRKLEAQTVEKASYERRHSEMEALVRSLQAEIVSLSLEVKGDLREWRGRLWGVMLVGPVVVAVLSEIIRKLVSGGKL